MYPEYEDLKKRDGFNRLSKEAQDFIREYCELGEIRFCDTCGSFIEGDFCWAMGFSPSLDETAFQEWVESRYEEDEDAPVFWTGDQFPYERNEGVPAEALEWLWKQTLKKEETA